MADTTENENDEGAKTTGATEAAAETAAPEASATSAGDAAAEQQGSAVKRRRRRAPKPVEKRKAMTPEERHTERVQLRRAKALARRLRRSQEREKAAKQPKTTAPASELPPVHAVKRGAPKERQGVVVSSKADKTITVRIDVARQHRRYEKILRSSTTLHAHDESNDANEGDVVRVIESRPLSRTKRWRLLDVVERAR
jgi:small subunit ribosomal protein S17